MAGKLSRSPVLNRQFSVIYALPLVRAAPFDERVQETVQSWQDVARASTLRERSSQHYERTN